MKTHLIQLEEYDDVYSVRDKMAWGKTARILLVWPEKRRGILVRRLDLLLVKRRAAELGAQLALVTQDPDVRLYARELEIAVFKTARQAQTSRWRRRRRKTPFEIWKAHRALEGPPSFQEMHGQQRKPGFWVQNFAFRFGVFLLGVLAVLAIAALIFPSAKITLTPQTEIQGVTFTALTGPSVTSLNPSGAIPTRSISVVVEGSASVDTTGSLELPAQPATGRVLLTNLSDLTVVVPEGTVLLGSGDPAVQFHTTRLARVPAEVGGTVEVPVTAARPGSAGNLPAGSIQSVEGVLGLQLTVTNPQPTSGGTNQSLAAPTGLDRRRAYRQLLDELRREAFEKIQDLLGPGDLLLNPNPFLSSTLQESYTPAETVPADVLQVALRLEFQGLVITRVELMELAQLALDASLEEGFSPVPGTLSVDVLSEPHLDTELNASWQVQAGQEVKANLAGLEAVNLALGQPLDLARQRIASAMPISQPPVITLTPAWWPRLPFLGFRIDVSETALQNGVQR